MKLETLLKTALMLLVVALAVVITSWFAGGRNEALAQGGGGSGSGSWIMVASELRAGEGLIYMFNTEKEVLLVYAYHRGRVGASTKLFTGDLQLLAGRFCKWDLLYSQRLPYPNDTPKSDMHTPGQMKSAFEKMSKEEGK